MALITSMQTLKSCRQHWIREYLSNACCRQNTPITAITSPMLWMDSLLTVNSTFICAFLSLSITNIGFLNVMAKCHPVNGSAYYTDIGPWITIRSLFVAWMRDGQYFRLISFKWFSDLVENIDRGGKCQTFCGGLLQGCGDTNWVMMGIIAVILHNLREIRERRAGPWGVDI